MCWEKLITMEKKKMRLIAYAKLLNKKINSAHKKAKSPFIDSDFLYNPFNNAIYNTLVWVEPDENQPTRFDNKKY